MTDGSVWIDDVELYEWSAKLLPYSTLDSLHGWSDESGSAWHHDKQVGHTNPPSMRVDHAAYSAGKTGATQRWSNVALQEGIYVSTEQDARSLGEKVLQQQPFESPRENLVIFARKKAVTDAV